jgi:hypothetical protein
MIITDSIWDHYASLSKIGVDLSYLYANSQYGFNLKNYSLALKNNIMTVQRTNYYFKTYTHNVYPYEQTSIAQYNRTCY